VSILFVDADGRKRSSTDRAPRRITGHGWGMASASRGAASLLGAENVFAAPFECSCWQRGGTQ
jgi:hypothetical protein